MSITMRGIDNPAVITESPLPKRLSKIVENKIATELMINMHGKAIK